jgi:hypothetical protein
MPLPQGRKCNNDGFVEDVAIRDESFLKGFLLVPMPLS